MLTLAMDGADAVSAGQRERLRNILVHGLGHTPLRTTAAVSELIVLDVVVAALTCRCRVKVWLSSPFPRHAEGRLGSPAW